MRPFQQNGVSLIIALIVLAAMAMIAVSLARSVDVATLINGNVAFVNDATNKSDICVRRAFTWITDSSSGFVVDAGTTQPAFNYFGTQMPPSSFDPTYGVPVKLLASADNTWMGTAPDIDAGGGVKVNCFIERMCLRTDPADSSHCQMIGGPAANSGTDTGDEHPGSASASAAYRVTTRATGVRGTAYTQVTLAPVSN